MNKKLLAGLLILFLAGPRAAFGDDLQDAMKQAQAMRRAAKEASLKTEQDRLKPVGHVKPAPDRYDIYSTNCHTAANRTVCAARDRSKVGVLACKGDPTVSLGNHTANWMLLPDGHACIYNWGQACCWEDAGSPPDISAGRGQQCAQWACGDQYCGLSVEHKTRCLPAGEKVEMPGPLACTVIAAGGKPNETSIAEPNFSLGRRPSCLSCCDQRAAHWDNVAWTADRQAEREKDKQDFIAKCRTHCNGFFQ